MRSVSIIGIGQTPVGELWEQSARQLAYDAISSALADANVERADALFVGNMLSGNLLDQEHLGTLVADVCGLHGVEAAKVGLSAEELDLIDAWFAGGQHAPPIAKRPVVEPAGYTQSSDARQPQRTTPTSTPGPMAAEREQIERWWTEPRQATGGGIADTNQGHTAPTMPGSGLGDELPRIVRSRQRG